MELLTSLYVTGLQSPGRHCSLPFCPLGLMLPVVQGPGVGTVTLDPPGPLDGLPVPLRMRVALASLLWSWGLWPPPSWS